MQKIQCQFKFLYVFMVMFCLRLKLSVASKWASKHLWGNIYFAGGGTCCILFVETLGRTIGLREQIENKHHWKKMKSFWPKN